MFWYLGARRCGSLVPRLTLIRWTFRQRRHLPLPFQLLFQLLYFCLLFALLRVRFLLHGLHRDQFLLQPVYFCLLSLVRTVHRREQPTAAVELLVQQLFLRLQPLALGLLCLLLLL